MERKNIYIDLNCNRRDKGIVGFNYCLEYNVLSNIFKKIESILSDEFNIRFSYELDDIRLSKRSQDANEWESDILLSLQLNALDGHHKGIESVVFDDNDRKLANIIHGNIINNGLYNVNNGVTMKNLHIVRECSMPSCIVKLGYIDNEDDYNLITNKYDNFADAICKGIREYFNTK